MRPWLAASVLSVVVWLAAAGCFQSAAAEMLEEVRIGDSTGDWGLPNPFRHYPRGPGYVRMSWVFDTLVWKDQKGVVPALADSWSYDASSRSFTFQLNTKAKWHDGRPVTADDVVFTVAYFKKHPYRWITLDHVERGEARGEHKVVLFLSRPYAPFMSDIAGTMPVIPRHIWEPVDSPDGLEPPWACIGSGPYRFRDFNKTQGTYLYEAFADYHRGKPRAVRLIYVHSDKPLVSLLTGQVDLAAIDPEMAEPIAQKGLAVIRDEHGWNRKLMINHDRPPFNDKRMRQALAFAIDRQEIVDKGRRGFGSPASQGMLSPDHAMYAPETPQYPFDPDRARKPSSPWAIGRTPVESTQGTAGLCGSSCSPPISARAERA